jgi:hypothetical protein
VLQTADAQPALTLVKPLFLEPTAATNQPKIEPHPEKID